MATIQSDLGMTDVNATSINAAIVVFRNTTVEISSSVGTLNVSLSAINAKVVSIRGTNATISTSLGNVTGEILSTENGTASIITPLGPVQLDVSGIPSSASSDQSWLIALLAIIGMLLLAIGAVAYRRRDKKE